ncbi:glycoside hydrolase family 43 protein [Bacillus sp. ISL-18]|uniref:glycoside hydrolase family 43 protein n=1 Tax=Bacillus sp. ISL-18 TaxID=2819118 RepID=UPI001BE63C23|nr:glycoside hydrolase family 43 protein [Bacillus sp. ISL-18]MBT2654046.1 glycoside hydrolase family 43 protein [Bacillus sp. ISL-18]
MIYSNPVISGFHPDPSICRVGKDYYLVTSSFEYFPGIPIFHSTDLVNWEQIGHVLTRESQLPLTRIHNMGPSQGIFAPTIRYNHGHFYVITTNISTSKNFYVFAEHSEGPWSEPIFIEGWGGIDPSLFFGENGRVYITGTCDFRVGEPIGIYQAELDIETGKLLTERQLIWKGTGGSSPEGPHLYKINGFYYLLIAEGGTEYGHMVTIARSRSPYGPYESNPKNPVLSNRSTDKPIQATGHADLVQAVDGSWWSVFLGIRPVGYLKRHHLGRETNLVSVHWKEEGWPIMGEEGQAELENDAKLLPLAPSQPWQEIEDFNTSSLPLEWNFYRNPDPTSWSLMERSGWLTLHGQSCTLNDTGSPAFVGRRQQHLNCEISTLMEFIPNVEGEEAGLTVFMNENFHYEIAKTLKSGKTLIQFRRRMGSMWKVEREVEYDSPRVILGIKADDFSFTFSFISSKGEKITLGKGESSMLSTEVAGGFTGLFFGMYATGNGKESTSSAHFDYFSYRPDNDSKHDLLAALTGSNTENSSL